MNHWTAEADIHTPALTLGNSEAGAVINFTGQRKQHDEHYGLHNFVMLDTLLKDHFHLN